MPSLSLLVDNFNDNDMGPEWGDSYAGATETGGRARVPVVAGTYAGYQTGRAWTFAGATVYLKLATRPAASTGTDVSANFLVTSSVDGTSIGFKYNAVTAMLRMQSNVDYYDTDGVEIAYSATDHLWLRLREDGTNVYWDTSPNGSTWTNRRTLATPSWITAAVDTCALDLYAYRNAGVSDYAEFDNVNTMSDGAVWDLVAALSGQSALTAAVKSTTVLTAALSAESSLTASATQALNVSADLAVTGTLTADLNNTEIPEVAAMAAGDLDLYIEQGATFVQTYTVTDLDFTWAGWAARGQIRSAANSAGELLLDLTAHLTVDGPAVRLAIPATVTQTLTRNGRWDLEMVNGPTVVRILNGRVHISPEVTR
jgi:hypothetical protein